MSMIAKSIVGDVINYRGMVYGPVNEMGVVALFALACEDLGFVIEEIKAGFPDCLARKQVDRGWERVAIEFEYQSSNFVRHGHDPAHCNLIVCWIHDWEEARVPVLELKPFILEQHARVSAPLERIRIADPVETRIVELSEGGIRNGYINLKPIDEFWPEECMGGNTELASKHLIVEFEGIGRLTTDISGRHKSLRTAHGTLKEFFSKHRLRPGDSVEILRFAKFEYRIRPHSA
jgi:hypothetical protein